MGNLDEIGFKFEVGEIVYHRITMKEQYVKDSEKRTPLLIVERVARECSGGVQLTYMCRVGIDKMAAATIDPSKYYEIFEVELER